MLPSVSAEIHTPRYLFTVFKEIMDFMDDPSGIFSDLSGPNAMDKLKISCRTRS